MKKLFLVVLAAFFALAPCSGEKVMTGAEIAKLDWKDFVGEWECKSQQWQDGREAPGKVEVRKIKDADDFEKFANEMKQLDDSLIFLALMAAGNSATLSGDLDGYRFSKGSITREFTIVKSADGKKETSRHRISCKKTK